jgi:predicted DNA-binding transcriptional regulator AlpA
MNKPLRLMNVHQVANYLYISTRTVWRWVAQGRMPPPLPMSCCIKRWDFRHIEQWLQSLEASQPPPEDRGPRPFPPYVS